jgi:predicted RNA-binding protein Jag
MGAYFDFCVKFDSETDKPEALTQRILYALFIRRIKGKKPVSVFIGGDSGEGKSETALTLQEVLLGIQGVDSLKHINDINIYTPFEYPTKMDNMLHSPELKHVNIVTIHEARAIIKAKDWHSFLNQAISDINAMSRSVKRIITIIISQFIKDIEKEVRYTITYYIKVNRPIGHKARLYISVVWKDDKDLEKPKLKKRRIRGYVIDNKGRYRMYEPEYIEIDRPSKEAIEIFEKQDKEAKSKIIRGKLEKLLKQMNIENNVQNRKVDHMIEWYIQHPENLDIIGKKIRGVWKVKPELRLIHDLTETETKDFQEKLNDRLKAKGVIEVEAPKGVDDLNAD